jgi:hypothetical protein
LILRFALLASHGEPIAVFSFALTGLMVVASV